MLYVAGNYCVNSLFNTGVDFIVSCTRTKGNSFYIPSSVTVPHGIAAEGFLCVFGKIVGAYAEVKLCNPSVAYIFLFVNKVQYRRARRISEAHKLIHHIAYTASCHINVCMGADSGDSVLYQPINGACFVKRAYSVENYRVVRNNKVGGVFCTFLHNFVCYIKADGNSAYFPFPVAHKEACVIEGILKLKGSKAVYTVKNFLCKHNSRPF